MKSFRQHLQEAPGMGLTVFDIDDTLFNTKAKIKVVKDGKVVKTLTNREFNSHKLQQGETYDFGQFRDADLFAKTSTPIGRMIAKAKAIIKNATARGSKVIVSTARSDMDNKDIFLKALEAHGIQSDSIYVERAGNFNLGSSAKNKKVVFRKYLRSGAYNRIRFFDDDMNNIRSFLSLAKEYPNIEFNAYHVGKNGSTKTIRR
jgi:hypothetical protein